MHLQMATIICSRLCVRMWLLEIKKNKTTSSAFVDEVPVVESSIGDKLNKWHHSNVHA